MLFSPEGENSGECGLSCVGVNGWAVGLREEEDEEGVNSGLCGFSPGEVTTLAPSFKADFN